MRYRVTIQPFEVDGWHLAESVGVALDAALTAHLGTATTVTVTLTPTGAEHPPAPLVRGQAYRVTMQVPGVWNTPRVSVMRYLGMRDDAINPTLQFDLRPIAGTQEVEMRYITSMEPTDEPLNAPRKVKR